MMHFPHLDGFAIFGGYGSNSSGIVTNFETDYNDMWLFNVTDCPNACNGRGKCSLGFCYCDEGFYGPDCQEVSCPDDYCVYDIVTQVRLISGIPQDYFWFRAELSQIILSFCPPN